MAYDWYVPTEQRNKSAMLTIYKMHYSAVIGPQSLTETLVRKGK